MLDLAKVWELKENLTNFVYDNEGAIATALENYAAEKGKKNSYGIKQQNLTVDLFLTQGEIEDRTPLDLFIQQAKLSPEDRAIVECWQHNFIGLFEIQAIAKDSYHLMNWLTAKTYTVQTHQGMSEKETSRWQPGEIILCILAPIDKAQTKWFFFGDRIIKGRLSQPKLAVAIGEFRDNYPESLYADAPDLLAEAWTSVEVYHQEFVDYMGSDRITLPGYKLNQKISELQQLVSKKKLAEAGIDGSKSLEELLAESGKTEAEFSEAAEDLGMDAEGVAKVMQNKGKTMVTPKLELPPAIKQAESVTVYSEVKWGQMFLPNHERFTELLATDNPATAENANPLVKKYLESPEANYYVWQQLKQAYPQTLEQLLQNYLEQPFNLDTDLDLLLLKYSKSATPELPAIASVPIHLNNLLKQL